MDTIKMESIQAVTNELKTNIVTSVFSKLTADVAIEFVEKFPNTFDFVGTLQRISKETGVRLLTSKSVSENFKLEGAWLPISRVHDLLTNTLAIYGASAKQESEETDNVFPTRMHNSNKKIYQQHIFSNDTKPLPTCTETASLHNDTACASTTNLQSPCKDTCAVNSLFQRGNPPSANLHSPSNILSANIQSSNAQNLMSAQSKSLRPRRLPRSAIKQQVVLPSDESDNDDEDMAELNQLKTKISDICTALDDDEIIVPHEGTQNKRSKGSKSDIKPLNKGRLSICAKKNAKKTKKSSNAKIETLENSVICVDKVDIGLAVNGSDGEHLGAPFMIQNDTIRSTICKKRKTVFKTLSGQTFHSHLQKLQKKFKTGYKWKTSKITESGKTLQFDQEKRNRGRPRKDPDQPQDEFQCKHCEFVGRTRNSLNDHAYRTHLAEPTKCDICEKIFPNLRYMKRHRSSHKDPQHCCDVCGKMYKIRKALADHKKTHEQGYTKPEFTCTVCPKSFSTRFILDTHVRSEHFGQKKSFLCPTCGKSFTTKHTLQQHLNVHSGQRPYDCPVCGKSFAYESALRDHKYIHNQKKLFQCEVCQKSFRQRSALKMHERIHNEMKAFVCSECGRGFVQKQSLQRHERAHKGEKPFYCKLCARTFGDASIIRRHMILVHKINKDRNTWREDIIAKGKHAEELLDKEQCEYDAMLMNSKDNMYITTEMSTIDKEEASMTEEDHSYSHQNHVQLTELGGTTGNEVQMTELEETNSNRVHLTELGGTNDSRMQLAEIRNSVGNQDYEHTDVSVQPVNMNVNHTTEEAHINPANSIVDSHTSPSNTLHMSLPVEIVPVHESVTAHLAQLSSNHHHDPNMYNIQSHHTLGYHLSEPDRYQYSTPGPSGGLANLSDGRYTSPPVNDRNGQGTLPRVENVLGKRIHEMEPPDNLSISSLYAYYTNLASQYINASTQQYPGYTVEGSNPSQQ